MDGVSWTSHAFATPRAIKKLDWLLAGSGLPFELPAQALALNSTLMIFVCKSGIYWPLQGCQGGMMIHICFVALHVLAQRQLREKFSTAIRQEALRARRLAEEEGEEEDGFCHQASEQRGTVIGRGPL